MAERRHETKTERNVRIQMRDGVELAGVLIRPDEEGSYPAIVSYGPYRRLPLIREQPTEENFDLYADGASYFAQRGYAVLHCDVRGTGNSGGSSQDVYSELERKDGYDLVEWIASQPWCNGKVGMWGKSYQGVVQWQVAVQNPPHLKALIVGSANEDMYADWVYPGGALRPYMFDTYSPLMTASNFAPPDMDVVGEKWTEIWDKHLAENSPWGIGYISHPVRDSYWTDRSLSPEFSRVKVPTMVYSGWADCYPTPMLHAFAKLDVPKKAFIGPWGHFWPESAFPGPRVDGRVIWLRWFDYWLKGIDNGVMEEPSITLWIKSYKAPDERMYDHEAGFWRCEQEWPLARTNYTPMYLHARGELLHESEYQKQEQDFDSYCYKPSVGISAGIFWGGGVLPFGMPLDQRHDEAYSLTYTSAPLVDDTEVTGDPKVILYVSSTADTAYFHVKITDVAPDGTSKWVTDGGLNATHRHSHAAPESLEAGKVYELNLDLKYVAYVFPKGHRIRVAIASSDFQNAWPTAKSAVNSIHRSQERPSRIVLPIVSAQSPKLPGPELQPWPFPMPVDVPRPIHEIKQDLINQTTTVHLCATAKALSHDGLSETNHFIESNFTVSDADPANASLLARCQYTVTPSGFGPVTVEACESVISNDRAFHFVSHVTVTFNQVSHFQKSWTISVPRMLN